MSSTLNRLIALAPLLALGHPASAITIPCDAKNQVAFFATFGDNTQRDDGAGSVDDPAAALYNMPPLYLANAALWWGNGVARTDQLSVDSAKPGVLQGYSKFDYEDTLSAFLRFDIYYWHYSNTEGFAVMDESNFAGTTWNFAYYDWLRKALDAANNDVPQWISVRVDLLTGNAYAWEIDDYGNPIQDYGQFARWGEDAWDSGDLYVVLKSASDGDLYTLLYDDVELSYVALYGITRGDNGCE